MDWKQKRSEWMRAAHQNVMKPVDIVGLHYVVRIFIGSCLAWYLMGYIGNINPLWAVVSMIAITEPQMKPALSSFRSRAVNTVIGCLVGLVFFLLFGIHPILLPLAAGLAAFISVHLLNMQQGWRVGPITAVLVMSAGLTEHSTHMALTLALERAAGVFTGSFVALIVTLGMSVIWMPQETLAPNDPTPPTS